MIRLRAPAFTLIELLLSIVILGGIMAIVYTAMFLVTGQSQIVTQEMSEDEEMRLLVRLISTDLKSVRYLTQYATPAFPGGQPPATGLIARINHIRSGDFSELSFHAAVPSRQHRQRPEEGDPDLHEVGYQVREDPQTGVVNLLRREDYYLNDDLENGGVTAILASGIEVFKLECLLPAAAPGQTQEQWTTDWNSMNQPAASQLPIALRLTFGMLGKSGRHLKQTVELNLQLIPPNPTGGTTPGAASSGTNPSSATPSGTGGASSTVPATPSR